MLETNGILLATDRDYVKDLSKFKKVHVRVSSKAGTPEDFTRKTGAKAEAFEIPFKAVRNLLDSGVSFHVAAELILRTRLTSSIWWRRLPPSIRGVN